MLMPQHRTDRSDAQPPSLHPSILPTHPCQNHTLQEVMTDRNPQQPHLTISAAPQFSTSAEVSLLTFYWRCCRVDCFSLNHYTTDTHSAYVVRLRGGTAFGYHVPAYRLTKCKVCIYQACGSCLLLQVRWGSVGTAGSGDGAEEMGTRTEIQGVDGDCNMEIHGTVRDLEVEDGVVEYDEGERARPNSW